MISKQLFYSQIIPTTLAHEGGYANHPSDKGGETYRGITRKHNPNWEGWAFIDEVKKTGKGLNGWLKDKWDEAKEYGKEKYNSVFDKGSEKYTIPSNTIFTDLEDSVKNFYYQKYFVGNQFHKLTNVEIAKLLFDYAVHGGYSVLGLQRLINQHFPGKGNKGGNVEEDNKIGPETINAINSIGIALKPYILQWRQGHLQQIIKNDPTQKVFEEGWNKRLASFGPVKFATKNKTYIFIGLGVVAIAIIAFFYFTKSKNATINSQPSKTKPKAPNTMETLSNV